MWRPGDVRVLSAAVEQVGAGRAWVRLLDPDGDQVDEYELEVVPELPQEREFVSMRQSVVKPARRRGRRQWQDGSKTRPAVREV